MNWGSLRTEWGAVTFVLTVVAGLIVVPIALVLANSSPKAIVTPNLPVTSSARASGAQLPTPSPSPTATPSPTK